MLEYNEITIRKYIIMDNEPYEVIDAHVFRMQQRKPQNKARLRNLISGRMVDTTFHQSDKVEEAEIEKKDIKYLYTTKGEWWFCEVNDPSKRFTLPEDLIGTSRKFIKQNSLVEALMFGERTIGIKIPMKVELKVTEAHPAVKGDTAKGGSKTVVLETGASINVPMFINEGDIIKINTETEEYSERSS